MVNSDTGQINGARKVFALIGWLALTFCASLTGVFVKTGGWGATIVELEAGSH